MFINLSTLNIVYNVFVDIVVDSLLCVVIRCRLRTYACLFVEMVLVT